MIAYGSLNYWLFYKSILLVVNLIGTKLYVCIIISDIIFQLTAQCKMQEFKFNLALKYQFT